MSGPSIFDALVARCDGLQRVDGFGDSGPRITAIAEPTGEFRPGLDRNERWMLTARVTVHFWANKAQFPEARIMAERQLAVALYGDFLADVTKASAAVIDGDRSAALAALDALRDRILR